MCIGFVLRLICSFDCEEGFYLQVLTHVSGETEDETSCLHVNFSEFFFLFHVLLLKTTFG